MITLKNKQPKCCDCKNFIATLILLRDISDFHAYNYLIKIDDCYYFIYKPMYFINLGMTEKYLPPVLLKTLER